MKKLLSHILNKEFATSSSGKLLLFIIALSVNVFWLYIAKATHNPEGKEIIFAKGTELQKDIFAAEYFIKHGVYFFGENIKGYNEYTYRLPGHLFIYLPLRFFLNTENTLFALFIITIILGVFAAYLLGIIALRLTHKIIFFYLTFFSFLGSSFVQHFNIGLGKEAITTYVLVIALFFLQNWYLRRKSYYLVIFSLLMTWCYLYRAFLTPLIFLLFIIIIYNTWKTNKKSIYKLALILLLPSFMFFGYWIPRNYILTDRLIILETSYYQSETSIIKSKLIQTWAGNPFPWERNSEASWFNKPEWVEYKVVSDSIWPQFLFNDTLTLDSLKKARKFYWLMTDKTMTKEEKELYDKEAARILNKFYDYQRKEYPFRTHISSKLTLLFKFLNQPIGTPLRSIKYPFNVILTFFTSFINYSIFIFGFLSAIILLFIKKRELFTNLIILSALSLTLMFPLFFDIELRRIAHAVPFLIISLVFFIDYIINNNRKVAMGIFVLSFITLFILAVNTCMTYIHW